MSTKAVSWVLHHVRVEPITKMILVAMAENADENGVCWPRQSITAEKACVSLSTVKRKLKALEQAGVISVIRRKVGKHKTWNKYRLKVEQCFDLLNKPTVSPSSAENSAAEFESVRLTPSKTGKTQNEGVSLTPLKVSQRAVQEFEGVTGDTFKGVTGDLQTISKPSVSNSNNDNTTTEDYSVFEQSSIPAHRRKFPMTPDWTPSDHVFDQLRMSRGVDREFALEHLPSFVTFHHGHEFSQSHFDAKYLRHVIHHFDRMKAQGATPEPIPEYWEPDQLTTRRLIDKGVSLAFLSAAIEEFRAYWRERGASDAAWNSKFANRCLQLWNDRATGTGLALAGTSDTAVQRFTDRSWAD
ncbi:MAG: DnaT-like ssDNA-binding domain-containing protein [Pseudohongiellaceae bacterium]|nr:DnaT-like ssDNA-binding domain-containing protein [Pseudohongiellaceae bacterium]